jgi:hypothetical protein
MRVAPDTLCEGGFSTRKETKMKQYTVYPEKLLKTIGNLDAKSRGDYILEAVLEMINGTLKAEWATAKRVSKKAKGDYSEEFKQFWGLYPKKVGKGDAYSIWVDLHHDQAILLKLCTDALSWQSKQEQWVKDNGQFVPNPSTYLRQRRFEDEPIVKAQTSGYYDEFGAYREG